MKENFKSLALIAENLAALYEDGLSITMSLELLLELPLNNEYKKSIVNIKNNIKRGNSLGESFAINPALYPKFFSGIVSIGENSGELSVTLRNLNAFYFNVDRVRRKVKNSLRYPLIIILALLILMALFFILIIPNLYETFSSINKNIPFIIKESYEGYKYLSSNKIYSIFLAVSVILSIILISRFIINCNKEKESNYILRLRFIRQYYEYIFMMIISIIVSSGIEISKGLDLCIDSIGIQCLRSEMRKLKKDIFRGDSLENSLKKSRFLSKYSLSMIALGEKSGDLDEVLHKSSDRLKKNLLENLDKVISYVTPAAIIVVTLFIVLFIFTFIVPMLDMVYSGVM